MKTIIQTNQLKKSFKIYQKEPGIAGSFKSLFKRNYEVNTAVKPFDLEIKQGEIVGLLGPNGAGKTTLMKMFTGIIVPSNGEISVLGYTPFERDKEFRKQIALVMGQKSQLWWDIPALDSLELLQRYYEIDAKKFKEKLSYMTELLGVKQQLKVQLRKLSLGERMKLELLASLLHNPKVIFLDEPTIGLDLVAQENIRNFVKSYHKEFNSTFIITSHYMADVTELCKRLVLIFDGKKTYDGPIESFENILGNEKRVSFSFSTSQDINNIFWKELDANWNNDNKEVDLRISDINFKKLSLKILNNFDVNGFHTEKLPIERVMKTLMTNPELLKENHERNNH
jgi:ABC-2 type transport system ATP-binding protein